MRLDIYTNRARATFVAENSILAQYLWPKSGVSCYLTASHCTALHK